MPRRCVAIRTGRKIIGRERLLVEFHHLKSLCFHQPRCPTRNRKTTGFAGGAAADTMRLTASPARGNRHDDAST